MRNVSDRELVERLPAEWAAYEEFYRRHVAKVTGFAVRRLDDPEQVADLVAATFLELMGAARRFDPARGEPVPWLLGIAARQLAALRRRSAGEHKALQRLGGQRLLDADDYARLEDRIDAARMARPIDAALAELTGDERELLELVGNEELTPTQAAEALGIRPATARMRLSRARRKARKALDDMARPTTARTSMGRTS
jgi:RNA polymerase sigma-70 factor (ECF subfamily)